MQLVKILVYHLIPLELVTASRTPPSFVKRTSWFCWGWRVYVTRGFGVHAGSFFRCFTSTPSVTILFEDVLFWRCVSRCRRNVEDFKKLYKLFQFRMFKVPYNDLIFVVYPFDQWTSCLRMAFHQ